MSTAPHHARRAAAIPRRLRPRDARAGWPQLLTSPWRCLPDFLIIGAQKSGTNSLYDHVGRHPAVWTAPCKECAFFTARARPAWRYRAFFPLRRTRRRIERGLGRPLLLGEATPYYLFHPAVPRRVARLLPEARLVVLLRDPVDRAYSHYRHNLRLGIEPLSFEAALAAEPRRIAGQADRLARAPLGRSDAFRHFSYVARGHYAEQLRRWFECFDRARVLVLAAESLFADPGGTTASVEAFLGLPPGPGGPFDVRNPGIEAEPMDDAVRARLRAHFAEPNCDLERLLGMGFPWPQG